MNENGDLRHARERATLITETLIPPFMGFNSRFNSLQEWLLQLCGQDPGDTPTSEYIFQLMYSRSEQSFVAFVGISSEIDSGAVRRKITFKPEHVFFPLPKREYRKLSEKEVKEKIFGELKQFTKTAEFSNSFMAKSIPVNVSFGGQLWPGQ